MAPVADAVSRVPWEGTAAFLAPSSRKLLFFQDFHDRKGKLFLYIEDLLNSLGMIEPVKIGIQKIAYMEGCFEGG